MTRDDLLDLLAAKSPAMQVPWYLMASFAYYHLDRSIISDGRYDRLCSDLDWDWDNIAHPHKHIIQRAALRAGTAFHTPVVGYPPRVVYALYTLLGEPCGHVHSLAEHLNHLHGDLL